ncbi:MAG: cytochrome C oxidase subunit IV family protein [Gemmatimonadales bacterium]
MDAHATAAHAEHEHRHPTPGVYAKVGFILFVLTALEVALYEITYGTSAGVVGDLTTLFVPMLLALSAAKFALVAMFYMHLKQDGRLLSGLFVFPLIIATVVIVSLMLLMAYHHAFARSG